MWDTGCLPRNFWRGWTGRAVGQQQPITPTRLLCRAFPDQPRAESFERFGHSPWQLSWRSGGSVPRLGTKRIARSWDQWVSELWPRALGQFLQPYAALTGLEFRTLQLPAEASQVLGALKRSNFCRTFPMCAEVSVASQIPLRRV